MLLWWLIAVAVGVQVLRRRISLLLVLAGALAWHRIHNRSERATIHRPTVGSVKQPTTDLCDRPYGVIGDLRGPHPDLPANDQSDRSRADEGDLPVQNDSVLSAGNLVQQPGCGDD